MSHATAGRTGLQHPYPPREESRSLGPRSATTSPSAMQGSSKRDKGTPRGAVHEEGVGRHQRRRSSSHNSTRDSAGPGGDGETSVKDPRPCFDVRTLLYDGPPMPTLAKNDDFSKFIIHYLRPSGGPRARRRSSLSDELDVHFARDARGAGQLPGDYEKGVAADGGGGGGGRDPHQAETRLPRKGSLIAPQSPFSKLGRDFSSRSPGGSSPAAGAEKTDAHELSLPSFEAPNEPTKSPPPEQHQPHTALTIAQLRRLKRETGRATLMADESIDAAESAERNEIDFLRDEYLSALKWFLFTEGQRMGLMITEEMMDFFGANVHQVLFRKMKALVLSNFPYIFREGIEGTVLTSQNCLAMVDTLVNLDSLLDADMYSCTFAGIPGIRFTAKIVTTTFLPQFYSWMAVKATFAQTRLTDREEWHDHIINFYYGHVDHLPESVYRAICTADVNFRLGMGAMFDRDVGEQAMAHGLSSSLVNDFFQFCVKIEHQRRRSFDDEQESTISINFSKGELVGKGSFGRVFRCLNVANGEFLALKEIALGTVNEKQVMVEIEMMRMMSHRNIIRYYGMRFNREDGKLEILMEFAPKSLKQIVDSSRDGLPLTLVAHYARGVLRGIAYLHEHHVISRDLKCSNCLVSEKGEVKLCDFGTAFLKQHEACAGAMQIRRQSMANLKKRPSKHSSGNDDDEDEASSARKQAQFAKRKAAPSFVGTPLFLSPELLRGGLADEASDIWAFGCLLIELVTGKAPWNELLSDGISLERVLFIISNATEPPQLPPSTRERVTPEFLDMLYSSLALDPDERPTARKLLQHPFLTSAGVTNDSRTLLGHSSIFSQSTVSDVRSGGTGENTTMSAQIGDATNNPISPSVSLEQLPRAFVSPRLLNAVRGDELGDVSGRTPADANRSTLTGSPRGDSAESTLLGTL